MGHLFICERINPDTESYGQISTSFDLGCGDVCPFPFTEEPGECDEGDDIPSVPVMFK